MSVKFFKKNGINGDATFTFTSANTNLASYLYDRNLATQLPSSGSDDVTPEVWEIEFDSTKTIDRVCVLNHNIKSGELKYWDGDSWESFTNTAVSWSANAAANSYFEVDQVATDKIQLTMNTTIVVDAEKLVGQILVMENIGEVETNPAEAPFTLAKRKAEHTTSDGGNVLVVFGKKYRARYSFSDASLNDVALFEDLDDLGEPFFVYPGGGDSTITNYGFRLQDIFFVNYTNDFAPKLKENLFNIGARIDLVLKEI